MITITHVALWRREAWPESIPSRPAWIVDCTAHPQLGKDHAGEAWGYTQEFRARGVATKHMRAYHPGADNSYSVKLDQDPE